MRLDALSDITVAPGYEPSYPGSSLPRIDNIILSATVSDPELGIHHMQEGKSQEAGRLVAAITIDMYFLSLI